MKHAAVAALLALLCGAPAAAGELTAFFGRATGGKDVDVARLAYRLPLEPDARWWWPTHLQLGASIWRVPNLSGTTRRYDANATAVWRRQTGRGYVEAGFGPYLLSRSINNTTTHLPSELQFGSHVGAGVRLGARASVGIALQHISNAGIEQPNGGIDLIELTAAFTL